MAAAGFGGLTAAIAPSTDDSDYGVSTVYGCTGYAYSSPSGPRRWSSGVLEPMFDLTSQAYDVDIGGVSWFSSR